MPCDLLCVWILRSTACAPPPRARTSRLSCRHTVYFGLYIRSVGTASDQRSTMITVELFVTLLVGAGATQKAQSSCRSLAASREWLSTFMRWMPFCTVFVFSMRLHGWYSCCLHAMGRYYLRDSSLLARLQGRPLDVVSTPMAGLLLA